jgi:hypothetical protein
MSVKEIIGRTITNIYQTLDLEIGGLDKGDCYIELDNSLVIGIPFQPDSEISICEVPFEADSIFRDLSDFPVYNLKKFLGVRYTTLSHYEENKVRHLKDQKIIDFLWYDDEWRFSSQGFFLLENGYLITQTLVAPHGLGMAGLNYYLSIEHLEKNVGNNYFRLSQ